MDFAARVRSLEQQSRELSAVYEGLGHRIATIRDDTRTLTALHTEIASVRHVIETRERDLLHLKAQLPRIARKEELERFSKRVDAMPFERFARSSKH